MTSDQMDSFKVMKEPKDVQDRYGNTGFGRGCLMARRLVEQGVPFVEVDLGGWDNHADIFKKSQFQKKLVGPALGEGLLTSEGEHWKFQRRAASPAFRIDALRALVPAFSSSAAATVERIKAMPAGQPVDVMQEMQHATLDVIVETILGGADPNFSYDRMAHIIATYMETMGKPDMLDMFGAPPWFWRPWGGEGRRAADGLKATAVNAIQRRRDSGEAQADLLGLLLAVEQVLHRHAW
jgi:cytochrome P450